MAHYLQQRRNVTSRPCSVSGCDKAFYALGLCQSHYYRNRKYGDPLAGSSPQPQRRAVDHEDGTRTCNTCGARKPLSEYPASRLGARGHRTDCRTCTTAKRRRWQAERSKRATS